MTQVETFDVGTPTTSAGAAQVVQGLRDTFASGRTRSVEWRLEQLDALNRMLVDAEAEFVEALAQDLGRPAMEAFAADLRGSGREIDDLRRHLRSWVKPERAKVPWIFRPGKANVEREPLGVVLIIAPWNYPVQLLLAPLVGGARGRQRGRAQAVRGRAGDLGRARPPGPAATSTRDAVAVVEGGVAETTALLERAVRPHLLHRQRHRRPRSSLEAAAKHLTPVTLELGGKSPAIVDARRQPRAWPPAASRGASSSTPARPASPPTTCSSTATSRTRCSTRLAGASVRDATATTRARAPTSAASSTTATSTRLKGLLDARRLRRVVVGGEVDASARYIAPTVLAASTRRRAVMQEEIFGPVLPVLALRRHRRARSPRQRGATSRSRSTCSPTSDERRRGCSARHVVRRRSCVNDTIVHIAVPGLPFGGVGESGMGAYHGSGASTRSATRRRCSGARRGPRPAGTATAVQALEDEADPGSLLTCSA